MSILLDVGKKEKYLRVRSDEELKAALKVAADKACRKEMDHARYLLRIILGLSDIEQFDEGLIRKARGHPQKAKGTASNG